MPVLKHLCISSTPSKRLSSIQAIALLLPSLSDNSLERLHISLAGNLPHSTDDETLWLIGDLLTSLGSGGFSHLTELSLRQVAGAFTPEMEYTLREALVEAIHHALSLSSVTLGNGWQSLSTLQALGLLPSLTKLALLEWSTHGMQVFTIETLENISATGGPFPSLQSLRVAEDVIRLFLPSFSAHLIGDTVVTHLPSASHVQPLRTLRLTYTIEQAPGDYGLQPCGRHTAAVHAIGCYRKTLERLSVVLRGHTALDAISFLSPLTSCTGIRHLDILGFICPTYQLDALIDHLPLLETLHWTPRVRNRALPSLNLCSLSRLSTKCPKLSDIRIPLDADAGTPVDIQYGSLVNLKVLDVRQWTMKVGAVKQLSQMLMKIAPSTPSFRISGAEVSENRAVWMKVGARLKRLGALDNLVFM